MKQTIKCLTVKQPWAWSIVNGHKDVENRSFFIRYRGPVIIQSSARVSIADLSADAFWIEDETGLTLPADFTLGSIEGIVTLTDVVKNSPSQWANPDNYHWLLTNPVPLPEHALKGKLGLWDLQLSTLGNYQGLQTITEYVNRWNAKK
jgi:hypothetical protein